ncbi:hypothetical protein [Comamonas suwonensis]|uniref:Zinc ribbon domain-containing protein n=1 Tax=Comamonas suwonensis TaxID=2606214 RepID=A0A843BCH1_9BURK|nr:hypothetical protein [Comamonas suwonensis]MBI1627022.1 hypothetical protein [Comamonas suwonensis]
MELLLLWIGFAIAVGFLAAKWQRSGFGWFLLACFISPLLAGIFLLIAGNATNQQPRDEAGNFITPKTHVHCPDCRELVRMDARKCKHCQAALKPLV